MLFTFISSKAKATLLLASLLCSETTLASKELTLDLLSTDAPTTEAAVSPGTKRQSADDTDLFGMMQFDDATEGAAASQGVQQREQEAAAKVPTQPDAIQQHEVVLDLHNSHYTSCLMNKRDQEDQLPLFARDTKPVVLKDKDDNEYYIVIYSSVSGVLTNAMGLPAVEFCHAVLTENTGRLGEALPEAKMIQTSRCYGHDDPGYDARSVEVQYTVSSIGVTPRVQLDGKYLYSQTPIAHTPVDLTRTIDNVYLDTFHTHYADKANPEANSTSPYYGYFMRVFNQLPATIHVTPVSPALSTDFNTIFDSNAEPSDIHSCLSIESFTARGDDIVSLATIVGQFAPESTPEEFFDTFDKDSMRSALKLDKQELGNYLLEDTIYDALYQYIHPFGATGFEFDFMSKFRTVTAVLDILYLGLMAVQKRFNGQYPSKRFAESMLAMGLHIIAGMVLIYGGTFLHIQNEISEVSVQQDEETWRQAMYYVYAVFGMFHSLTVGALMPKVMGEKRITIPFYFGAGVINMTNAIVLARNPSLKAAFCLWGSVNTFIYVRFYIVLLSFAHIDWELLYTYAILAAGATTYPLSVQDVRVYYVLAFPVLYAPFHERFCRWFPWLGITEEDWANGNRPSEKNIHKLSAMLRTYAFDKGNISAEPSQELTPEPSQELTPEPSQELTPEPSQELTPDEIEV